MALFAGVRAEPVPDDAPAAAIHQAMVIREMRGSAHLAAITAVGLPTKVAHAIKPSRRRRAVRLGATSRRSSPTTRWRSTPRAEEMTNEALVGPFATLTEEQAAGARGWRPGDARSLHG